MKTRTTTLSLQASTLLCLAALGSAAVHADGGAAGTTNASGTAAPTADASAQDEKKAKADADLQEIVVVGMRENLEKSLDIKRDASVVLDSINSTELGRFPDDDVADSLAHLPGISIERTTGGEGQKITVRGLSSEYNIVTMNNRILASDDDGRDLAFDVLPAEVISGADVLKSAQASAVEGSIGGTVNLRTASPFDSPGLHGGIHAEGNDNTMSDLKGQKYSAFVSDTVADDTLGFVFGAVRSDDKNRTDSLNAYQQNIYGPTTYPYPFMNSTAPTTNLVATPCCITFGSIFDDKRRDALSGKLEWRPSSTLTLTLDGLWTHLTDPQIGYNESYYFAANPDGTPWSASPPVIKNGVITAMTVDDFQPEMVNNTTNRNVVTTLYGFNAKWQPLDRLSFAFDMYRSAASRPEGGEDTFVTAGLVDRFPNAIDILNFADVPNSLPNINVVVPPSQFGLKACPSGSASKTNPGYCSYTALMNSGFLNNNNDWSTHYVGLNGYSVHDQITGFTLDGAWDAKLSVFDKLQFGAAYSHRDKSRDDQSNDWTNGSGQYGTLYQTAGCPIQCNPYSFGSQGFNVISMVNLPNFMQGAGGSYPVVLPQINAAQLLAFLKSLNGKLNPFFCPGPACVPFNFAETLPQVNPYNSYSVTENTLAEYLEADFSGSNWSGNIGVRVVHTTTTAITASAVPTSLWTPSNTASSVQSWNVQYGASQAIGANGSYTIPLPSANLAYWVVPDKLQLRLGLAETMARPNLSELAPTSTNNAINGTPQLYYNGTAGLKPIKANQADISLEWYYTRHSALALAVFGKKIRDDIYTANLVDQNLGTIQYVGGPPGTVKGTPFLWTVQAPANGAQSTFTGVELTWQHIMDNGFGTHMQYTATKTRSYDQFGNFVGAINAAPPTTWSIGFLYEKGPIAADVTWDHQSGYIAECSQCTEVPGWPAISEPFDWLTASLHYHFWRGFEVYVEGKNLTNAIMRTYLNGNPLLPWAPGQNVGASESGVGYGYSAYGRTYVLGAAYRF
jgi:iron complex outermembrane receptor protein